VSRRVIICGSRGWSDRQRIEERLFYLPPDAVIVHGAARGVDRIAHQEAEKAGFLLEPHPAEWERYGKRAGFIRNEEMANLGADLLIAFWDGRSRGTLDMMERCAKYGIPIEVNHKDFPNRPRRTQ
jgi:YspA, cpYpsA-related SLOG family